MKKLLSILLALCMTISLCAAFSTVSFAEGTGATDEVNATLTVTSVTSTNPDFSDVSDIKQETLDRLTDGVISPDEQEDGKEAGNYYIYANNSVSENGDGTWVLTIEMNTNGTEQSLSGLRFYSRRWNSADNVEKANWYKIRSKDNVGKATVYVSGDGINYFKSDVLTSDASSDERYVDLKLKFDGTEESVSGVKYIKVEISKLYGRDWPHFGVEEIKLLNPNTENTKSIHEFELAYLQQLAADLDKYKVLGGVERKNIITAANAIINNLNTDEETTNSAQIAAIEAAEQSYTSAVKELDTVGNMTVGTVERVDPDGVKQTWDSGKQYMLTDGSITKEGETGKENGVTTFFRADWCVGRGSPTDETLGYHLLITLNLATPVEFSGLRTYTRKQDVTDGTDNHNSNRNNIADLVNITVYDADNNKLTFSDVAPTVADGSNGERVRSYADYSLGGYSLSDVTKIELDLTHMFGAYHWGAEEIRLLDASGSEIATTTVTGAAADVVTTKINAIDTRVVGSIENVKTINAAREAYDALSETAKALVSEEDSTKLTSAKAVLDACTLREVDTNPGSSSIMTVTGESDNKTGLLDESGQLKKDESGKVIKYAANVAGLDRLTDGYLTAEDEVGDNKYGYGDYGVFPLDNEYLHLTVKLDSPTTLSGVRFYDRTSPKNATYNSANRAKTVQVTLYTDKDNHNKYVKTDILTVENKDGYLCDAEFKFGGKNVTVEDVVEMEITIFALQGSSGLYNHWGSEEMRLLIDSDATQKTVADTAKSLVTLSTPTFESGVYEDNTGIIRFITEFTQIAEGAEIESFGTYAIGDKGSYDANDVTLTSDKIGKYEVSTSIDPKENNTFYVDVVNIPNAKFSVPVTAVSFVKIKGLDELILSDALTGATVNDKNKLKTETTGTTTETTGTEE